MDEGKAARGVPLLLFFGDSQRAMRIFVASASTATTGEHVRVIWAVAVAGSIDPTPPVFRAHFRPPFSRMVEAKTRGDDLFFS
jgi:hypothetical protein